MTKAPKIGEALGLSENLLNVPKSDPEAAAPVGMKFATTVALSQRITDLEAALAAAQQEIQQLKAELSGVVERLAVTLAQERADTREACAQIAETMEQYVSREDRTSSSNGAFISACAKIAAAIRAGQTP